MNTTAIPPAETPPAETPPTERPPVVPPLGQIVQRLRHQRGMTLADLARASGASISALSRMENGQMSPTYESIVRLAHGLGVEVAELFGSAPSEPPSGRRAITRAHTGMRQSTTHYDYEMLCAELSRKAIVPLVTAIRARSLAEFHNLHAHPGEEFVYVLSGAVTLHTEHYAPALLNPGDSAYFDSRMGHALLSASVEDARVLWIATSNFNGNSEAGVPDFQRPDFHTPNDENNNKHNRKDL